MDLLAQTTTSSSSGGIGLIGVLLYLVVVVVAIAAMWKTFVKAGQPGWAAIVPIYNIYIMLKIAEKPGWWLLLYFIPFANIVVSLLVSIDTAKLFGKSTAFGVVGLWLFSLVGYLMLGFGDATYKSVTTAQPVQPVAPTQPPAAQL